MDFIGLQNLNVRPSLDTNAAEKRDIISHFLFDIIPNVYREHKGFNWARRQTLSVSKDLKVVLAV